MADTISLKDKLWKFKSVS